ncbi:PEP-CTERM sorting domain-containing protein [Candidatus Kuenenbacteria bacterium]|nr:PEP-CTERM sorting domain-containing protein [Candidatus Kuenenbacteria bacterium]
MKKIMIAIVAIAIFFLVSCKNEARGDSMIFATDWTTIIQSVGTLTEFQHFVNVQFLSEGAWGIELLGDFGDVTNLQIPSGAFSILLPNYLGIGDIWAPPNAQFSFSYQVPVWYGSIRGTATAMGYIPFDPSWGMGPGLIDPGVTDYDVVLTPHYNQPPPPIPEPATLWLLGTGLLIGGRFFKEKKIKPLMRF